MATPERDPPPRVVVILHGTHHAYNPLSVCTSRPEVPWFGETTLPPDVKRVVTALACLAPVEDVSETPLVTAAWCWDVPLWRNPLLTKEGGRGATGERPGLEFRHPEMRGCRVLHTRGDALQARDELEAVLHAPNQTWAAIRTA
jgi:hypothetical protein